MGVHGKAELVDVGVLGVALGCDICLSLPLVSGGGVPLAVAAVSVPVLEGANVQHDLVKEAGGNEVCGRIEGDGLFPGSLGGRQGCVDNAAVVIEVMGGRGGRGGVGRAYLKIESLFSNVACTVPGAHNVVILTGGPFCEGHLAVDVVDLGVGCNSPNGNGGVDNVLAGGEVGDGNSDLSQSVLGGHPAVAGVVISLGMDDGGMVDGHADTGEVVDCNAVLSVADGLKGVAGLVPLGESGLSGAVFNVYHNKAGLFKSLGRALVAAYDGPVLGIVALVSVDKNGIALFKLVVEPLQGIGLGGVAQSTPALNCVVSGNTGGGTQVLVYNCVVNKLFVCRGGCAVKVGLRSAERDQSAVR